MSTFKYKQKVRVTIGFYEGLEGVLVRLIPSYETNDSVQWYDVQFQDAEEAYWRIVQIPEGALELI